MKGWRTAGWWLGAAGAAVATALALGSGVADRLELPLRDLLLGVLPAQPARHVAVVAVDDASLAQFGPWPWPRRRLADLATAARRAGCRGVAVDVLLAEPDGDDQALAAALGGGPAWLVGALQADGGGWLLPAPALRHAAGLAHGAFELDHDGVLRSLAATKQAGGTALPALAVALAGEVDPRLAAPVGRRLTPDFRTAPADVPHVSAGALLAGAPAAGVLSGRVALIGVTATGLGDRVVTPRSARDHPDPGVLVHAAAAECLVAGGTLTALPPLGAAFLAAALVGLAGLVSRLPGRARLPLGAALVALPAVAGLATLPSCGIAVPVVCLTGVVLGAVLVADATLVVGALRSTRAAGLHLRPGVEPRGTPRQRLAVLEALAAEAAQRAAGETEARRVAVHELKTPLTSLRGLSQLLRDYDLDAEEQRHVADLVHREAARLHSMVDTLLDLERLGLRAFEREAAAVELRRLVAERVEALGRGGGREVHLDAGPEVTVRGAADLLSRVVDNLVGNAVKYSPPDAPVLVRVGRVGGEAFLEVEDRGPGVPSDDRERIFGRFARGASTAEQPGLGLGLALVSEVVAWHGGRVEVGDAPGGGSVFCVRLPAAP